MTPSPELVAFVAAWEDFRQYAYLDMVGVPTIGYGFTRGVQMGDTMTRAEADARLAATLADYWARLQPFLTREPSQQQADALTSIAYNCGVDAIGNSGLVARFNEGDDDGVCERFLRWSRAGGRVVPGLLRRRQAEVAIYQRGDYSWLP